MTEYLFSYGTLQNEDVQNRLFGRTLTGSRDTLKGYKLLAIEIRDEAFLSKGEQTMQQTVTHSRDENDAVKGTVFEISEQELLAADSYEPTEFRRVRVTLASGKGSWIYTADGAA